MELARLLVRELQGRGNFVFGLCGCGEFEHAGLHNCKKGRGCFFFFWIAFMVTLRQRQGIGSHNWSFTKGEGKRWDENEKGKTCPASYIEATQEKAIIKTC